MTLTADTPKKYDELHFFLDESGKISEGSKNEPLLAGGVLWFGPYTESHQKTLRQILTNSLTTVRGFYPNDLHYCNFNTVNQPVKNNFATHLSKQLEQWQKKTGSTVYGILIQHKEDQFSDSTNVLDENKLDNRYLLMLWTLIEHHVFVNDNVKKLLTADAKIHLHIANRAFPFKKDESIRRYAESRGWEVQEDRENTGQYVILSVLDIRDLHVMFRMAVRDRWKTSQHELASAEVTSLNYKVPPKQESTPALYLADIVLGVERERINSHQNNYHIVASPQTFPILDILEYNHGIEALAIYTAHLDDNNVEALVHHLEKNPLSPKESQNAVIFRRLSECFGQNPEPFYRLFETALAEVDWPLTREHAREIAYMLEKICGGANRDDLLATLYIILIQFSFANHTGDVDNSNTLWEHFQKYRSQLPKIGCEKGFDMEMNFLSRRAVNLMDKFMFAEAVEVLLPLDKNEHEFLQETAKRFEVPVKSLRLYRYGVARSSLAQVCACHFTTSEKRHHAETYFKDALRCFTEPADKERILVYMGHLACDYPEDGLDLWNEVFPQLHALLGDTTDGYKKPFVFAVLAKGALVFSTDEDRHRWAQDMNEILSKDDADILRWHPYGLIQQTAALLNAAVYQRLGEPQYREAASKFFDTAKASFDSGGTLLQLLGAACQVRQSLCQWAFASDTPNHSETLSQHLKQFIQRYRSYLASHVVRNTDDLERRSGETVPEHAKRLLRQLIRFNYW